MLIFLAATLLAAGAAQPATEMDYADGALAYQALVQGDLSRALKTAYDDTLREEVPKDFLDLLGKLS